MAIRHALTRRELLAGSAAAVPALRQEAGGGTPRFRASDDGGFEFNTGILSGKLHGGGKSVGLLPVTHVPSGATLTRSMGFAGHYRVFTTNHRYGPGAWYWPSEASLRKDGSVETRWSAADDRPFEMRAVYRWAAPATLDVVTSVEPRAVLPGFESFLAFYFSEGFTHSLACVKGEGGPHFQAAEPANGTWQMFPRDRGALALIRDGRWKIDPNPVDWAIMPELANPIGVRRDDKLGLTAIVMAPAEDCFAVAMPHQAEGHYSLYLSQFGRTLEPGKTARARVRLVIAQAPTDAQILESYRAFLAGSA